MVSALLSCSLMCGAAPVAWANQTQTAEDTIASASAELTRLNQMAEMSEYDLISTSISLDQTRQLIADLDAHIAKSAQDLESAKRNLSRFVTEDYKTGSATLLDILLNSVSMDDFVSRIVYANKFAELHRASITQVETIHADLLQKRAALAQALADKEHYIDEQSKRLAAANDATEAAQMFYDQLPSDVQQAIDAEAEVNHLESVQASLVILEEIAQQEGIEIQDLLPDTEVNPAASVAAPSQGADAEASANVGENAGENTSENAGALPLPEPTVTADLSNVDLGAIASEVFGSVNADAGVTQGDAATARATTGGDATGSTATAGTATSGPVDTSELLSRAYELLGSGYQYSGYNWTGSTSDSAFTCSGVVDYALGRDSQSSSPESLYEEVGGNLTTNVDNLNAGDLVFYGYGDREVGHVGVYVGDGYVLDSIPEGGVGIRPVDYMDVVGGGSL